MKDLFSDPNVVSFVISYGASVAWDATKAGVAKLANLLRQPEGNDISRAFVGLRQEEQLRQDAQHLVNNVLKRLPEKQRDQAVHDMDFLSEVVLSSEYLMHAGCLGGDRRESGTGVATVSRAGGSPRSTIMLKGNTIMCEELSAIGLSLRW